LLPLPEVVLTNESQGPGRRDAVLVRHDAEWQSRGSFLMAGLQGIGDAARNLYGSFVDAQDMGEAHGAIGGRGAPPAASEAPDERSRANPVWWYGVSACTEADRRLFFGSGWDQTKAKAICEGCVAKTVCLFFGASMEFPAQRYGTFGGMTAAERDAAFRGMDHADIHGTYVALRAELAERLGRAA
jgi:hypothetical protein